MSSGSPNSSGNPTRTTSEGLTEVGQVLSRKRSSNSYAPPPMMKKTPDPERGIRIGRNRLKPEQRQELALEPARKSYTLQRADITRHVDKQAGMPDSLTRILTQADNIFKTAKTAEDVARAIQQLRPAAGYIPDLQKFNQRYRESLDQFSEVRSLDNTEHKVLGTKVAEFHQAIEQGQKQFLAAQSTQEITQATEYLAGVCPVILGEAQEAAPKIGELVKKLSEAEGKSEPWLEFSFIDMTKTLQLLGDVQMKFWTASTVKEAKEALKGLSEYKKARDQAKKDASECIKELEKYRNERRKFLDQVHEASILRGASTDPAFVQLLEDANSTVEVADTNTQTAKNIGELKISRKMLTQKADLLSECKKRADELKKLAEKDLEAIPEYNRLIQELRETRTYVSELPGTEAQIKAIDNLLAQHRISSNGEPAQGYNVAVVALRGKAAEIKQQAESANREFVGRAERFGVAQEIERLNSKLAEKSSLFTGFYLEAAKVKMAQCASIELVADAVDALQNLSKEIDNDANVQTTLQSDCLKLRGEIDLIVNKLSKANAPAAFITPITGPLESQVKELLKTGQFLAAKSFLIRLKEAADKAQKAVLEDGAAWQKTKEKLEEVRRDVVKMFAWPAVSGKAVALSDLILELFRETEQNLNYAESVKQETPILNKFAELKKLLTESNITDISQLDGFEKFRIDLKNEMEQKRKQILQVLGVLETKLKENKVLAVTKSPAHLLLQSSWEEWQKALDTPKLAQGQDPKEYLIRAQETLRKHLSKIVLDCNNILKQNDTTLLDTYVNEAKKGDVGHAAARLIDESRRLVSELELMGVDTQAFQSKLSAYPMKNPPQTYVADLKNIYLEIKQQFDQKQKEILQIVSVTLSDAEDMKRTVHGMKSDFYELPGYFEDMERRLNDLTAMLNSGDPTLIQEAQQQLSALKQSFSQATSGQNDPNIPTLKTALAKWQSINKTLGKDDLVRDNMRDTYDRIKGQMIDIMTRMSKAGKENSLLDPAVAMEELLKMESTVNRVCRAAEVQKELYKKFKAKYETIELPSVQKPNQWVETDKITALKKLTSTRVTEKTEGYWNQIETRLAKAKDLAGKEGHIHEAFKELEAIEQELDKMLEMPPDLARAELQKKNAAVEQDQRTLRDMIRQWETEYESFKSTVIPDTRKAMEKNPKADMSQIEGLDRSVSFTNKQLEPYLFVMSALPHRYLGANEAPDMQEAIQAFGRARKELETHRRTAERLARNAEGTNYDFEADLRKVQAEWIDRAKRFSTAVVKLATEIGTVVNEVSATQGDKNFLEDPARSALLKEVPNLKEVLAKFAKRFDPGAFDDAFSTLCNKDLALETKRTARETALRTVRLLKSDLADNPLSQAIRRAKLHPFGDIRSEMGLLFAGLKKVEISVLVSVD